MTELTKNYPTYKEKTLDSRYGMHPDRQNTVWSEEIVKNCKHEWQPVSFCFESYLAGINIISVQPDLNKGRVYCVCMKCLGHTYVETGWVGFYLGSPDDLEED